MSVVHQLDPANLVVESPFSDGLFYLVDRTTGHVAAGGFDTWGAADDERATIRPVVISDAAVPALAPASGLRPPAPTVRLNRCDDLEVLA